MLNFLLFFTFICFVSFSVIGFGFLTNISLSKKNLISKLNIGEIGVLGFLNIYFISLLLHFFSPLYLELNLIILSIGFLIFIFNYKKNIKKIDKKLILYLLILFLFGFFNIKNHPDFDWYYLPYVNYLNHNKIIFGIATINDFLSYTHVWKDIIPLFNLPFIGVKGLTLIPIIFCIFCLIALIENFKNTRNIIIKFFIFFILVFIFSNYSKTSEYGGDVTSTLLGFIVLTIFLEFSLNKFKQNELLVKIIIFFFFLCLLRINYIILLPCLIYIYLTNFKFLNVLFFKKYFMLPFALITILFFTKNIIHSGCALYPIPKTCLSENFIEWSLGSNLAEKRYYALSASSKGWQNYLSSEIKLSNRYDYYKIDDDKILLPYEYINKPNFFWFRYWIKDGDIVKIVNSFLIIFFSTIILLLFSKIKKFKLKKFLKFINRTKYILITLIFTLLLWLNFSPQSRYAGDVIIVSISSFVFSSILFSFVFKKGNLKKGLICVVLLSIVYFEYKNLNRLYKDYDNFTNFPFSNINNYKYIEHFYSIIINDVNFNLKKNNKNSIVGMPTWCGNIEMLCLPEDRFVCIETVKNKNYKYIIPNREKCQNHVEKRLWY
tara:strand:+ start:210 stop:2021 length:1812 start_codon:yes stop_codon:yes gene_type:complete